jgi:peptide/nickel transport system ATP-binding protein
LQCAPENGEPRDMLPAIPGTVPNLTSLPGLCFPRTLLCRRGEMQRNAALNANGARANRRPAGIRNGRNAMSDVLLELDMYT